MRASQVPTAARRPPRRFLGLQWRVTVILSITLLLITSIVVLIMQQRLEHSFRLSNEHRAKQLVHNWHGFLGEGDRTLDQLAAFVPLLEVSRGDPNAHVKPIERVIAEHSALLDLEWGIQAIAFFDPQGRAQGAWPALPTDAGVLKAVQRALGSDEPASAISCSPDCVQYLAAPQLNAQQARGGVLLLGRSLADAIVSFARVNAAELVILTDANGKSAAPGAANARYIPAWQSTIPALSHPQKSLPLVEALSRRVDLQSLAQRPLQRLDNRWYYVALERDTRGHFVYLLFSDVTDHLQQLNATRRIIILNGVLGFVTTTLLLIGFLSNPLTRLRTLVGILPLIGLHQHAKVRQALPRSRPSFLGNDEIDVLVGAVGDLNEQLEQSELARAEAEEQLSWLADHDPLTGLFNRRRFQRDFSFFIRQAVRYGRSGALLYFDLDDFKVVNDLSGHQAGDELLRMVSSEIKRVISSTDLFARLGGDEFALVLAEASQEDAVRIAEQMLGVMQQLRFSAHGIPHRVSGSVGIALFPQHGEDPRELLANADLAMYQAKKLGQGRWYMFSNSDAFRELLSARSRWRDRISHALENDQLVLHFQPILDLASNRIVRHEALVRMLDTDGSLIYPQQFIQVAEQTGQIGAIDRWVISKALETVCDRPELSLSVNLSGGVVDDPSLLDWLKPQLDREGVDPGRIVFEITETAAVQNIRGAIDLMHAMQALGCRFALDDFGSGFASYNYLKQMPVDLIKIDGAFIRHLADNRDDQLFVKALTDVAHGLGKATIAEFVGDAKTLALLRQYGVGYAQGYFIGKPSAEPMVHFLPAVTSLAI